MIFQFQINEQVVATKVSYYQVIAQDEQEAKTMILECFKEAIENNFVANKANKEGVYFSHSIIEAMETEEPTQENSTIELFYVPRLPIDSELIKLHSNLIPSHEN